MAKPFFVLLPIILNSIEHKIYSLELLSCYGSNGSRNMVWKRSSNDVLICYGLVIISDVGRVTMMKT